MNAAGTERSLPARTLGRVAVGLLVVAVVLLVAGAVIVAFATLGHLVLFGTPPGAVIGGVIMALGAVAALAGAVVGALGLRQRDAWCIVGAVLNGALLAVLALAVVGGVVIDRYRRSAGQEILARWQTDEVQRLQREAAEAGPAWIHGLLRERILLLSTRRPPARAVEPLTDGWRLIRLYQPTTLSSEPRPERMVAHDLCRAATVAAGWLGREGRHADAAAVLAALAEAETPLSITVDGQDLEIDELHARTTQGPLDAAVLQALIGLDPDALEAIASPQR